MLKHGSNDSPLVADDEKENECAWKSPKTNTGSPESMSTTESEVEEVQDKRPEKEKETFMMQENKYSETSGAPESLSVSEDEGEKDHLDGEAHEKDETCMEQDDQHTDSPSGGEKSLTASVNERKEELDDEAQNAEEGCMEEEDRYSNVSSLEGQNEGTIVREKDQASQQNLMRHIEPPDLVRAGLENTRKTFHKVFTADDEQEPPVLSECYGEPLSREDCMSDTEGNQERGETGCIDSTELNQGGGDSTIDNIEDERDFEDQAAQLKSSLYMRKCIHMRKHKLFENTGKKIKFRYSNIIPISNKSKASIEEPKDGPLSSEVSSQPFSCLFCGKWFNTSYSLKKHICSMHMGDKPYRCLECGKRFGKEIHLVAHKKVHQRRIQCTVCKKILPTIGDLIQHRQSH
uniref:C2H2-type domain-containing protein n=1 Tax=Oncorhynchus tshawytscha TaxID=74940 RepID=A0AAZ3SHX0_ONCTS